MVPEKLSNNVITSSKMNDKFPLIILELMYSYLNVVPWMLLLSISFN